MQADLFGKESILYTDLIPKLRRLDPSITVPECYYGNAEEGILVMEDLKKQGYATIDKTVGEGKFTQYIKD
jgi:hypothetical protein